MKFAVPESLAKLRVATFEDHKSLESLTDSDALLHLAPQLAHYQQFLVAHYSLHRRVATSAAQQLGKEAGTQLLDWPTCPRLVALEQDFAALQVECPPVGLEVPQATETHGYLLGLIYVCEGSCIGNQRLFAALNKHDCFRDWQSSAFLRSCKEGFAERWRQVIHSIDLLSTSGSAVDGSGYADIEQGALAGFKSFRTSWLGAAERTDATA